MSKETAIEAIDQEVKNNKVILFAKGTKEQPRCGLSSATIQILNSYNIPYKVVNVLEDFELKEALKDYSEWPTIPQLYINSEFIGGCDITRELHESGELKNLLANIA